MQLRYRAKILAPGRPITTPCYPTRYRRYGVEVLDALATHDARLSTLAPHTHTHTRTHVSPPTRSAGGSLLKIEGQWENRCHWLYRVLLFLTCGLFGGRGIQQTDFGQLARIMARIFHTEVCVRVLLVCVCFLDEIISPGLSG